MNEQDFHIPRPQSSEAYGERRTRRLFYRAIFFFGIVFFVAGSFWSGYTLGKNSVGRTGEEIVIPLQSSTVANQDGAHVVDFSLFWDAWDLLKEKYVDREHLDAQKLLYGAITGMLRATGDPYTTFLTPEQNQMLAEDLNGSFEGIGAEIGMRDNTLTVIAPLEGSPAERAGLRSGDRILEIDGTSTIDFSVEEAVKLIRGKKGSVVTLTIFRDGDQDTKEIAITRDVIDVKSVRAEILSDQIVHIRVSQFGENTTREFNTILRDLRTKDVQGIVLDLRNNPGGFLNVAVDLASRMLPRGTVVVLEEDNTGKRVSLSTSGGDLLSVIPTVVLINEGSASASEILAGALRDQRSNVKIVGEKSFGKGSVQELIDLKQDTAVKITVAKWLTPSGKQINEQGITPDIESILTPEDADAKRDPQMEKALELLRSGL